MVALVSLFFLFPPTGFLWALQISNYTIHWMLFCLLGGIIALFLGFERLLYFCFISSGVMAFFLMNSFNTELKLNGFSSPNALNVLFVNPTLGEDAFQRLSSSLLNKNPDIIILEEFTPDLTEAITPWAEKFPYQYSMPRIDPLGKAVLSKFPISVPQINEILDLPVLTIQVINPQNDSFQLMIVNHLPPVTLMAYQRLTLFLDKLSDVIRNGENNFILVADFNVVPWSRELRNFRQNSGLMASRMDNTVSGPSYKSMDILNNFSLEIMYSKNLECSQVELLKDSKNIPVGVLARYQEKFVF